MTRPTPTQGAQSEAARVPRVSDAVLRVAEDELCSILGRKVETRRARMLASDIIETSESDKDATIADLERRLGEAERRGFEAGRDAAASIAALHYSTRHWQGTVKQVGGKIADAIRFLAPAVPQEGETTP